MMDTTTITSKKASPSASASKLTQPKTRTNRAERVWKIIALLVSVAVLMLGNKIYLFHTMPEFANFKKGEPKDIVIFSIPFAIIYMALDYLSHYFFDDWVEKNYLRQDKYKEKVARMRKSYTLVKWAFGIVFYSFTSIFAYLLLKDSYFLPPLLGGRGSVFTLVEHRYLQQTTQGMRMFYLIEMGKHLARFFMHIFIRSEGSYYEYVLHHSLSVFLVFFSYTMNMWTIGIFVLFVHDISDVFLALGRGYRQCKVRYKILMNIINSFGAFIWIFFRIIAFSYCCIYAAWSQFFRSMTILSEIEIQILQIPHFLMAVMLSLLQVMHIYWTYYIVQSFIASSVSEKVAVHSYD